MRKTRNTRLAHHRRGLHAETLAGLYLQLKAYRILARRYKTPGGEIDLVAKRGKTLAFVEVKARKTFAEAAESIHPRNQQRVVRAAQHYLAEHPEFHSHIIRFDAVLIVWYRWPKHIAHAFDTGDIYA